MADRYLFRAKHVHTLPGNKHLDGTWVYGYLSGENYIYSPDLEGEYLIDPSTICQCTGHKDIWEHDIIEYDGNIYEIVFDQEELVWWADCDSEHWYIQLGELKIDKIKVIGNTIDNPELLEVEE